MTTTVTKNPKIPANDKLRAGESVGELLLPDVDPDSVGVASEPPPAASPVLVVAASTQRVNMGETETMYLSSVLGPNWVQSTGYLTSRGFGLPLVLVRRFVCRDQLRPRSLAPFPERTVHYKP
jgi:hypothetical protein